MNYIRQRVERLEYKIELLYNALTQCLPEECFICLNEKHDFTCPQKNKAICWLNILEDDLAGIDTRGKYKEEESEDAEEKESLCGASVQG